MNIDLGYLGKVVLEGLNPPWQTHDFTITHDGYTESGIRVHVVVDDARHWATYPRCWNDAILIKVPS